MVVLRRTLLAALVLAMGVISGYAAVPASGLVQPHRTTVVPSANAPAYVQAVFNTPTFPTAIRDRELQLVNQFEYSFNLPGEIRMSAFQFSDLKLAKALVKAAENGASVQVLLDGDAGYMRCDLLLVPGGCRNEAYFELTQLNTINSTNPTTWLRTCNGIGPGSPAPLAGSAPGCIGQVRNHNKFLLVSSGQPGTSGYLPIVVQTSSNSTATSYQSALNNALVISGQPELYADYEEYFEHLAASYRTTGPPPSISSFVSTWGFSLDTNVASANDLATWSFPQHESNDPVADVLKGIGYDRRCRITDPIAGDPIHTRVEIAMSVVGGRPLVMAQLSRIAAAGCVVRLVYSRMSARDHGILKHAGVRLTRLCNANPYNPTHPTQYVHSKYVLIEGDDLYFGHDVRVLYTGSENWTNDALSNTDDRMLQYLEPASAPPIAWAYARNFTYLRSLAGQGTPATVGCGTDE